MGDKIRSFLSKFIFIGGGMVPDKGDMVLSGYPFIIKSLLSS
jgi:hypothetical protein